MSSLIINHTVKLSKLTAKNVLEKHQTSTRVDKSYTFHM